MPIGCPLRKQRQTLTEPIEFHPWLPHWVDKKSYRRPAACSSCSTIR
jgi:hypothetical protein